MVVVVLVLFVAFFKCFFVRCGRSLSLFVVVPRCCCLSSLIVVVRCLLFVVGVDC